MVMMHAKILLGITLFAAHELIHEITNGIAYEICDFSLHCVFRYI